MHFHLIKITSTISLIISLFPPLSLSLSVFLSSPLPMSFPSGGGEKCCRLESGFNRFPDRRHVFLPLKRVLTPPPPQPPL